MFPCVHNETSQAVPHRRLDNIFSFTDNRTRMPHAHISLLRRRSHVDQSAIVRQCTLTMHPLALFTQYPHHTLLVLGRQVLILCNNTLSGRLPEWLGELSFLRHVDFADNSLDGTVPPSLAGLSKLVVLLLHHNKLDGRGISVFMVTIIP